MRFCLPVIVALCVFTSEVQAMDAPFRPCTDWNTARKANLSSVVQREWAYGYLSGLSDAYKLQHGTDIYSLLPTHEAILAVLNQYCEQHPQATVDAALRDLFYQLRPEK